MSPEPPMGVDPNDIPLFHIACELLAKHYRPGRHEVASAFLLSSGKITTGIHVEGSCGRSSICAEGMALGASLTELDVESGEKVEAVVAVLYVVSTGKIRMIAPCGVCRELLFDYCPEARCYTWSPPKPVGTSTPSAVGAGKELNGDGRGFDLDKIEVAPGEVNKWKVRDLLPDKMRRVGW